MLAHGISAAFTVGGATFAVAVVMALIVRPGREPVWTPSLNAA